MSRKPAPARRERVRAQTIARRPAPKSDRKIHFLLTDAYLVAANTGQPLTHAGLEALCRISRSAKEAVRAARHQPEDKLAEPEQLEAIRERWLEAFEANPERMARDATREAELAARLQGELLFELMQNANDAAAALLPNGRAMMRGRTGRGFRSVLSVTDQPRIHSGDISFAFDPRRTHKAIKKRLGRKMPDEVPVFRLPFPCSAKDEPQQIRALIGEYDTVVVMPFRSLRACERCREGWDTKRNDVTVLKSLPALNLMIWERDDATVQYKRTVRNNMDRLVPPAPRQQRPRRVELTVDNPQAEPDGATDSHKPASEPLVVKPRVRSRPKTLVSASIVRHPKGNGVKSNGAAASAARKAKKPSKPSASSGARNGANGATSSNSKPTIKKSATTARVSVSEKDLRPAAKKPAAKKPTRKAAASSTKSRTAKAPAARKPAAKKPAATKTAGKRTAAKKPAAKNKSKTTAKAATKKTVTKKAAAKPRTSRSKSRASTKKS